MHGISLNSHRLSAISIMLALVIGGCSSTAPLQSSFRSDEVAIDGSEADWYGHLRRIEKEDVSLGVSHDEEFLYVSLLTNEPEVVRQIMARGLVLWLDPEGGKEQEIG